MNSDPYYDSHTNGVDLPITYYIDRAHFLVESNHLENNLESVEESTLTKLNRAIVHNQQCQ
jgi:hypothetical protein